MGRGGGGSGFLVFSNQFLFIDVYDIVGVWWRSDVRIFGWHGDGWVCIIGAEWTVPVLDATTNWEVQNDMDTSPMWYCCSWMIGVYSLVCPSLCLWWADPPWLSSLCVGIVLPFSFFRDNTLCGTSTLTFGTDASNIMLVCIQYIAWVLNDPYSCIPSSSKTWLTMVFVEKVK